MKKQPVLLCLLRCASELVSKRAVVAGFTPSTGSIEVNLNIRGYSRQSPFAEKFAFIWVVKFACIARFRPQSQEFGLARRR
jgi:hypothetical protein